ncbi:PHP domain-containing protein [Paenibacillus sp. CMAA1364]
MSIEYGKCDLHTHTQASDGMQSSSINVKLAKEKGLSAISITDHDTVAGIEEALAAGEKHGIVVVPGVEISTRSGGKDIHILGYYVDYTNVIFLERLVQLRETRQLRNGRIIDRLQQLGLHIELEDVINGLGRPLLPDESIGRPHIADVLVHKGYATDMRDAFDRYLAEGAQAFVSESRISPKDACIWIREAGGSPVLAHPGIYGNDVLVRGIINSTDLAGIEVYHSDHGEEEELRYASMAQEYDLIMTGGSDFHGARQGVVFHGDIGSVTVPISVLEQLKGCERNNRFAERSCDISSGFL